MRRLTSIRFPASVTAAILVAAVTASPVVYLLIRGFEGGVAAGLSSLVGPRTLTLLARTLALATTCTIAAMAIGIPLALLTVRARIPFRRTLTVLLALPLVIPSYIAAYTLIGFAGPRGILSDFLDRPLPSIYGFAGAAFVIIMTTYPLVMLAVRGALRALDPSVEEASLLLGASRRETFRRITWPAIRPAASAGGLLVMLYAVHDFGAVSLLRYDSFSRAIFVAYQGSFDRSRAALLSIALVIVAIVVTRFEIAARARSSFARLHGTAPRATTSAALTPGIAVIATVGIATLLMVALVLPVGVLAIWIVRSARSGTDLGPMLEAARSTISVAATASVVTLAAAWPLARVAARARTRLSQLLESIATTGYALPGVVVALSLVFLGTRLARPLYQTLPLLVLAYVILFLPLATATIRTGSELVPASHEEASRVLGVSRVATFWRVLFPALRPSMLAAAALVFLAAAKELPATALLSPPGFRTLAMSVFSETSAARFDQAAVPALALVLVSVIPLAMLLSRDRLPEAVR